MPPSIRVINVQLLISEGLGGFGSIGASKKPMNAMPTNNASASAKPASSFPAMGATSPMGQSATSPMGAGGWQQSPKHQPTQPATNKPAAAKPATAKPSVNVIGGREDRGPKQHFGKSDLVHSNIYIICWKSLPNISLFTDLVSFTFFQYMQS